MNEPFRQFNSDLGSELKARFQAEEFASLLKAYAKDATDDRTFEVVMSTSDEDRQGDSLDQSRWDLKYYEMNPVVLWAHNYSSFPIGIIEDIKTVGEQTVATGRFAPEGVNPDSDMACKLYQEKILRAVSPGYIQCDDGTRELLEVSFCPVPAGRYALSLRQVGRLGVSTQELVTKGFFYAEEPPEIVSKSPQVGDTCQLEDGTPGTLAEDPKNPGELRCVPERDKSTKTETDMNNELIKTLKAEHERHAQSIGKAIDEFESKGMSDEEGAEEAKAEDNDNSESEKAIDEFKDAIDGEQGDHLDKCMKAVDEYYETMGREENKSIDEFKSEMQAEHLEHVKAFHKAIDEFKSDHDEADGKDERDQAFSKCEKAMSDELDRHEKCHMDMCKAEAERMGEGEEDGKSEEKAIEQKSGRSISAKNRERLDAVCASIENHHGEVAKAVEEFTAQHRKHTDDVIAAIKGLYGSEEGDEGEEKKPDEKSGSAPNQGRAPQEQARKGKASEQLEAYLLGQRLVRQIITAAQGAQRQFNEKVDEKVRETRSGR